MRHIKRSLNLAGWHEQPRSPGKSATSSPYLPQNCRSSAARHKHRHARRWLRPHCAAGATFWPSAGDGTAGHAATTPKGTHSSKPDGRPRSSAPTSRQHRHHTASRPCNPASANPTSRTPVELMAQLGQAAAAAFCSIVPSAPRKLPTQPTAAQPRACEVAPCLPTAISTASLRIEAGCSSGETASQGAVAAPALATLSSGRRRQRWPQKALQYHGIASPQGRACITRPPRPSHLTPGCCSSVRCTRLTAQRHIMCRKL